MSTYSILDAPIVPLESLLRHVAPSVPQVPYSLALDKIRQRYIEFARKSSLLIHEVELPIQKDVANYFLEPPAGYEVFSVRAIWNNNIWQGPSVDRWFAAWGYRFYIRGNQEIVFETAPSRDEQGRMVQLVLLPDPCNPNILQEIASPFGKGIALGALADMLMMPKQVWTDKESAAKYERDFNRAALSGRNLGLTGRGGSSLSFKPVRIL